MSNDKRPIVEIKITGFLPITPADAEVLEYMTNINVKHYKDMLGSKFEEKHYADVLERVKRASEIVLEKNRVVQKAARGES